MQTSFTTERLLIDILNTSDHEFILELLNSEGWIKFIGDRNLHSKEDAVAYINKILDNPGFTYWVVRLKNENIPIGIISFIKRDYLKHHDIGFAFLPGFNGAGYALEAAREVLDNIILSGIHTHMLATTLPQNINSIKLLNKLGLQFDEEIQVGGESLHVYSIDLSRCVF